MGVLAVPQPTLEAGPVASDAARTPPPPPGRTAAPRLRSLDGLRGAAALLVVVHHALLMLPSLSPVYYATDEPVALGTAGWLLAYTPLHLVWGGSEAVYLFFVLSGLVLMLPVIGRGGFSWLAYYPRRVVRLYGPVWAAVALGLLCYLVAERTNDPAFSEWVNRRPNDYPWWAVLEDLTLLDSSSGRVSPLWSLQWEVLFSLLLPVYVVALRPGRRADAVRAVLLLVACALGSWLDVRWLFYLPMFGVGALTALRWPTLRRWAARCAADRSWWWPAVLAAAVLLTTARWWLTGLGLSPDRAGQLAFLAVPGAWLLVVVAAFSPGASRLLERPFLQWAGRVSFSLYLVHEPVLLSVRFLTPTASPVLAIAVGVPLAVGLAVLFERQVEARFHRLSQRVGRAVDPRRRRPR